ncbi:MAG: ATP-binding protein, partial [Candidatus Marinimicrobia bacterium]|nr:ATP-binding protein [Candidatus Neomarinimicrobiota bacterium]
MSTEPVVIGKNIIEILTTGMYDNPLVIYREYVQNSVDAINQALSLELFQDVREGEINITVNPEKKYIEFYDNATGIPAKSSWNLLTSIADSTKDRNKHLGFRGIGRLAGLAYCEKLT